MENSLKIVAWIDIVLGALAVISSIGGGGDLQAFVGGGLFLATGVLILSYIKGKNPKA